MTARKTYTEDQRIAAVAILLEHGGMTHTGLALAREYLQSNVSTDTFHKWLKAYSGRVQRAIEQPKQHKQDIMIITDATESALVMLERIRDGLLKQVDHYIQTDHEIVDKASLQRVMTSIGIAMTKISETTGMTAQMQAAIRPLAIWCNENNIDIYAVLPDILAILQRQPDEVLDKYRITGRLGSGS